MRKERDGILQASEERADVKERDDVRTVGRDRRRVGSVISEILLERRQRDDSSSDTGVVCRREYGRQKRTGVRQKRKLEVTHNRRGRCPYRR
jgi:hypothetical protein